MAQSMQLTCQCGKTEWIIDVSAGTKVVCHCADCQTFANHLDPDRPVTDDAGGTHIFQTLPDRVLFTKGAANLSLLRLSPKGLMRWYTSCCRTPVANTLPRAGIPFVGLILPPGADGFGRIVARAFTDTARRPVKGHGMARAGLAVLARAVSGRIAGAHRASPFYDSNGAPVVRPTVLTKEERRAARPR